MREKRQIVKENIMKKKSKESIEDDLRKEYDFTTFKKGVRGKYFKRYHTGTNLVLLDPDVAKAFPTDDAVNEALRLLAKIAQNQQERIT